MPKLGPNTTFSPMEPEDNFEEEQAKYEAEQRAKEKSQQRGESETTAKSELPLVLFVEIGDDGVMDSTLIRPATDLQLQVLLLCQQSSSTVTLPGSTETISLNHLVDILHHDYMEHSEKDIKKFKEFAASYPGIEGILVRDSPMLVDRATTRNTNKVDREMPNYINVPERVYTIHYRY